MSKMRFTTVVLVLSSIAVVFSVTVPSHTNLVIANKVISPDGFNRSAVLAGITEQSVTHPGPVITASKGDEFQVNVIDSLTDSNMVLGTSIHWHGLFQHGTNYDDGAVGVNQCPISAGHSFLYKFSVPNQAGTYWYHSHDSTQYCDGLRGVIVIYDDQDPHKNLYDFDDESTVITLSDWYHAFAPTEVLPLADSTLINGIGRYAGGTAVPLSVITVLPNKRYRFRLVSISCDPNFTFSIDGHNMTIIEVDGVNHQPLLVDSIQIFVGQRYSFILQTDMPISNYWIRANPNQGPTGFVGGINSAILRYSGAPDVDPVTTSNTTNSLLETNLHPLDGIGAPGVPTPGAADVNLNLNITFNGTVLEFFVNGVTFKLPSVPVLLQILSGAKTAQELLPSGSIFALPPNKVIEISMQTTSPGAPHPIHLHGHDFYVIRSAGSSVYNFVNPVRRDVVNSGLPGDNVTIRFETDNAGPWFLHCHIDWHLNLGLAVVLAEDIPSVMQLDPPDAWDQLCPIFNSTSTY